jgi:hypothetical protein
MFNGSGRRKVPPRVSSLLSLLLLTVRLLTARISSQPLFSLGDLLVQPLHYFWNRGLAPTTWPAENLDSHLEFYAEQEAPVQHA